MTQHGVLAYKTCREMAGYTQEDAAEQLNCSVRSLARYESGEAAVPDGIAYRMVVTYDSQYLAVQHLRLVSQVAAEVLPAVHVLDLPVAAIRIINRVREFADRHRDQELLLIAEDGVISPDERPLFDEIMADLDGIMCSSMELKLSEKGEVLHGTGEGSLSGQPGTHPCSLSREGDRHAEGTGDMAAYGQQDRKIRVPDEGRRHTWGHMLDLSRQSGPGDVVNLTRTKKDRPVAIQIPSCASRKRKLDDRAASAAADKL